MAVVANCDRDAGRAIGNTITIFGDSMLCHHHDVEIGASNTFWVWRFACLYYATAYTVILSILV